MVHLYIFQRENKFDVASVIIEVENLEEVWGNGGETERANS
jgi:hypothetical protein